jgi:hypothetical protein
LRHIPFHLLTSQFHRRVRQRLTADGVYAVNVVGHEEEGLLLRSVTHTLVQDFPHVRRLVRPAVGEGPANVWLIASGQPLAIGQAIPDELSGGRTLTDNNAPIEALVAWDLLRGP